MPAKKLVKCAWNGGSGKDRVGPPNVAIVAYDIQEAVAALEQLGGVSLEPIVASPGIYKMYKGGNRILLLHGVQ